MADTGALHSRRMVAGMGRAELEDKHLSLLDENHLLKKHARAQEEKMKKMATKLLKLATDERREARRDGQPPSVLRVRELEEEVEELVLKIRHLERNNTSLQNKVAVLRQQCESKGRRKTAYDHVQSRISSGLIRQGQQRSVSTDDVSPHRSIHSSPTTPRYGRSLLEEARRDNQELEEVVLRLKQEVSVLTAETEKKHEQMRLQAAEHEQLRLELEQQLQVQSATRHKRGIEDDVEVIRVQKELREKSDRLLVLQTQHSALEKNLEAMHTNHTRLLQEIDQLNSQLKEEQTHGVDLQGQLHSSTVTQSTVVELRQMVDDLRAENNILKETNNRLMKSVLVEDRGSQCRGQLRAVQERIGERGMNHKTTFLTASTQATHSLPSEREVGEQVEQRLQETYDIYHPLPAQCPEHESSLIQEGSGLCTFKGDVTKRDVAVNTDSTTTTAPVQPAVDTATLLETLVQDADVQRKLSELRLSKVNTAAELEKIRQLLTAQRVINQDYKKEVDVLRDQVCQLQSQHSAQLSDQSRLLSERAAHVRQLQNQIRDMACDHTSQETHQTQPSPSQPSHQLIPPHKHHTVSEDARGGTPQHTALPHSGRERKVDDEGGIVEGGEEIQGEKGVGREKRHKKKRKHLFSGNEKERKKEKQSRAIETNTNVQLGVSDGHKHSQSPTKPVNDRGSAVTAAVLRSETGPTVRQLPPLRTATGETLPPLQLTENGHHVVEDRKREQLTKETYEVDPAEVEVEDDDSITSVTSLSHSSSGLGTPSTSTPLKPTLPPPSSTRQHDAVFPPFSSSLSVITEPPANTTPKPQFEVDGGETEVGSGRVEGGEKGGGNEGFTMVGGGAEEGLGSGEDGDSVSVTVTEMSDEGEEDTMFEETLPQHTLDSIVSGRTISTPTQPSVRLATDDEEESALVSPSLTSGDDETLITPSSSQLQTQQPAEDTMSLTIVNFIMEPGSSLITRAEDTSGYFVEFQLLDYDYGVLETPSVFIPPHSAQPITFNFKTDLDVDPSQKALLASALQSTTDASDRKVIFTVVSDPIDQEADCKEVGTAELDLISILHRGEDIVNESIDVVSCDEDGELLGRLTVTVHAIHILKQL